MADEPTNMTERLLRDIQATLADHGQILNDHTKQFAHLRTKLDSLEESVVTALGFAAHANVRHESVQKQLEALQDRVSKLEEKV